MMIFPRWLLWVLVPLCVGALGCASRGAGRASEAPPASSGHGYALLYEILGQERQVSNLLVIKAERDPLERVIDEISEVSDAAYARLDELADADPALNLTDTGLPAEERKTREAIAATRQQQLLGASGQELELQLLLTQNEALVYASHLADTLSRSEPDPARLAFVRALWRDLARLQQDVLALLRRPRR